MNDATRLISLGMLRAAAPHLRDDALEPWVEPIRKACERYEINTIRRIAAFIATLAHEGGFRVGARENMNYSAKRLSQVWPGRFRFAGLPNATALRIGGNPELIANLVYAGRMGNGPPDSGDGWRFRGIASIQLTGRRNWQAFADEMGMTLDEAEAYMMTVEGGVMSAAWFWETNDINRLADTPGVADETKRINGGEIGIEHRKRIFDKLVGWLLAAERKAA